MVAVSSLVLAACFFTFRAQADNWDKTTRLTVKEPVQAGNMYLAPGTYTFQLQDSNRHIVQIFNGDRSHLIGTIIALPAYRLNPTGGTTFTFWETPPGSVKALRDWYYPGDNFGQEFKYPVHLRQVAAVSTAQPAPPPADSQAIEPAANAIAPTPAPAPQTEEQAPAEPPAEVAQNKPPPSSPAPPSAAAQQAEAQANESLPHTASQYTTIGLGGLLVLGLYLGLRSKQFR